MFEEFGVRSASPPPHLSALRPDGFVPESRRENVARVRWNFLIAAFPFACRLVARRRQAFRAELIFTDAASL
jgi:hypothetical protein